MLIKDVMEKTLLSKKAIRYYEDRGLFETERSGNGYKDYSDENVERLLAIRKLRDLGFSIEEIRDFLDSDEKKSAVLTRKMNEAESKLSIHSKEREILESLLDGKPIGSFNSVPVEVREEKPYMYIRNVNKVFGVLNLIVFLAILFYILFIKEPAQSPESGTLFVIGLIPVMLIGRYEEKRAKLKRQGVTVLERKPIEIFLRALAYLSFYVTGIIMSSEFLYAMQRYISEKAYLNLAIASLALLIFLVLGVFAVITGFFEDTDDIMNYFARRRRSSDKM
ncbi:MAG: MerR family transcriptional regulator [Clostridiaceae bacterium]|mgnify:CR=1 FL=1|nr:MerR family transcriptional regulator [Clostridiaceae bacterium]